MNPNLIINIFAFAILTLLWLAFGYGLLFKQEMVEHTWRAFCRWSLLAKLIVTLLALPLVVALWIWNARMPIWLRLILVAGLAWTTEAMFFPAMPVLF